jgi:hypothetical protein
MSTGNIVKLRAADAFLFQLREAGLIVVPHSPTGSMTKAARRAGGKVAELSDAEIESVYFLMTNAWLTRQQAQSQIEEERSDDEVGAEH